MVEYAFKMLGMDFCRGSWLVRTEMGIANHEEEGITEWRNRKVGGVGKENSDRLRPVGHEGQRQ